MAKAGFATPRGGAKGAYQNHAARNNKVIIPFEWLAEVKLENYPDGYVVRLLPDQYFADAKKPRPKFLKKNPPVTVDKDAFVLYRTHDDLNHFQYITKRHELAADAQDQSVYPVGVGAGLGPARRSDSKRPTGDSRESPLHLNDKSPDLGHLRHFVIY